MDNKSMNREEIDRLYIMIDNLAGGISAASDRIAGVERIVSNGLSHRTERIEDKIDAQDSKLDTLINEMHGVHRRIDGCLERDEYVSDKRKEWDGIERRNDETKKQKKEWTARIIIGTVLAIIGAISGYLI